MRYILVTAEKKSSEKKEYKKGDRIVVAVDDDCFLATVTRIANGQIYLKFDDGDTGKVSVGSKRILGEGIARKVKKPFSKKEAKNYTKPSVKKVTRLKDTPRAARRQPDANSNDKNTPPSITKDISKPKSEEDKTPKMSDYSDNLKYIEALWEFYNDKYFSGRMKKPKFLLKKNVKALNVRGLGVYSYRYYRDGEYIKVTDATIKISPFIFRDEKKCREVMIHEMCHQATAELDRLNDGHGKHWAAWAKHCGIDASRLTKVDDLYNDEEKQEIQQARDKYKSILDKAKQGNTPVERFAVGMPCKFYSTSKKTYITGRIVYLLPKTVRIVIKEAASDYTTYTVDKRVVFKSDDDGGVSLRIAEAFAEYYTVIGKRNVKGIAKDIRDSIAHNKLMDEIRIDLMSNNSSPVDKKQIEIGDPCSVVIGGSSVNARVVDKYGKDVWVVYPDGETFNAKRFNVNDVEFLPKNAVSVLQRTIPNNILSTWKECCYLNDKEPNSLKALIAYYNARNEGYSLHNRYMTESEKKEELQKLSRFALPINSLNEGEAVTIVDGDGRIWQGRVAYIDDKDETCITLYKGQYKIDYINSTKVFKPLVPLREISRYIPGELLEKCADYYESIESGYYQKEKEASDIFRKALDEANNRI